MAREGKDEKRKRKKKKKEKTNFCLQNIYLLTLGGKLCDTSKEIVL